MTIQEKECSRCKKKKELSDFHKHSKALDGKQSRCKECQNEIHRTWSKENSWFMKERIEKRRQKAFEYKGGKCEICGLIDPILNVYDYHHIDPKTKEYNLARVLYKVNWDKIKLELDKCMLLCSNCHRRLHYQLHLESRL